MFFFVFKLSFIICRNGADYVNHQPPIINVVTSISRLPKPPRLPNNETNEALKHAIVSIPLKLLTIIPKKRGRLVLIWVKGMLVIENSYGCSNAQIFKHYIKSYNASYINYLRIIPKLEDWEQIKNWFDMRSCTLYWITAFGILWT